MSYDSINQYGKVTKFQAITVTLRKHYLAPLAPPRGVLGGLGNGGWEEIFGGVLGGCLGGLNNSLVRGTSYIYFGLERFNMCYTVARLALD